MKKSLYISFILIVIFSCNSQRERQVENIDEKEVSSEIESTKKESDPSFYHTKLELNEPEIQVNYQKMDSSIRNQISKLDSVYKSTPYYADIDGLKFFIVANSKWGYKVEEFTGVIKYGIVNDSLDLVLPLEYDKIYNPNLTLKENFEIKKNGKVGLFNYKTGIIINPQFDFILPGKNVNSEIAYGLKNSTWFKLQNGKIEQTKFDPTPVLQQLSFDVVKLGSNMMYDSYFEVYKNDPTMGRGVVITPSYLDYFGLSQREFYPDVILSNQEEVDFGLEAAGTKTSGSKSISNRIMAFFISFYETGIDARDYYVNETRLVIYQNQSNTLNSTSLVKNYRDGNPCSDGKYQFVNDSIVEIKTGISSYNWQETDHLYNHQTLLSYKKILNDGSIVELKSNRYFDFTKYILIDETYFSGCFIKSIDPNENDGHNIIRADHLSIRDLDIMRNEIFADYGYIFKSEEWSVYFTSKPWYEPRFDNVNDKLTEIDKANIKVILEVKEAMLGREEEFTKERKSTFYAAG